MSKWILQRKAADYAGLSTKLKVDPVIVRLMVNRGLTSYEERDAYLHPSLNCCADPHLFADMDLACELLMEAIDEGVKIRVVGDYDVDGNIIGNRLEEFYYNGDTDDDPFIFYNYNYMSILFIY